MKLHYHWLIAVVFMGLISCDEPSTTTNSLYKSESLEVKQLTDHTYVHITYLDIPNYGLFPCNGLIYVHNQSALVFDTPTDTTVANELIRWINTDLNAQIKGVVVNHFHVDCLGGLEAFHRKGIPSYANQETIELAQKDSTVAPQNGFESLHQLSIGSMKVVNQFFGKGHTADNIVSYIPSEGVLFGGCMIKEVGAGKGNLKDATVGEWPQTVEKIKNAFPDLKHVVPGHGATGGVALLDYTIDLFREDQIGDH